MEINTILVILWLIFSHWVADFICQDEAWALKKKESFVSLLKHTLTYSCIITAMFFNYLSLIGLLYFFIGTLVSHTFIDYFTSKIVGKRFADKHLGSAIPNMGAFTIIGFDQVLHYISMIFLLYFCYRV